MSGRIARISFLALLTAACARTKAPAPSPEAAPDASLLFMVGAESESLVMAGGANLFEVVITPSTGQAAVKKGGDIPASGQTVKVDGLPADPAAALTGALYKNAINPATKTHSCASDQTVALVSGQTATASLTCIPTVDPTAQPVKVFVKVAALTVNLAELDPAQILGGRDFTQPTMYTTIDKSGRRITLKQDKAALHVHVGGDVSYLLENDPAAPLPLVQLLAGAPLTLKAVAGQQLQVLAEDATLTLNGAPLLYEVTPGQVAVVLPIKLVNTAAPATVSVDGRLFEEPAQNEITVVSYNVENLFDQVDDDRNSTYGDYRLTPNAAGQSSNYGAPVDFNGVTTTWTDVKVQGIKKTLVGLDPAGPEVVGMVEVESQASMDAVLAATADLGYTSAIFSEWIPPMVPTAIGMGLLTKLPVLDHTVLAVATPAVAGAEPSRPILKVTLDVAGQPLVVYVNHWKSKSGPESQRILYAQAVEADIQAMMAVNPKVDFIVMGDMNSEYNEKVVIEPAHNDANGLTGLNNILHAQGDELLVLRNTNPALKYNLQYELNKSARKTAWYPEHDWSALDNMIVGAGMYDQRGVTYIDNSFTPATPAMPRLQHLFNAQGGTNRWIELRQGATTTHQIGGYSDHLPISARFRVSVRQNDGTIWLGVGGKPDATDTPASPTP